jgi:hypothetical protein
MRLFMNSFLKILPTLIALPVLVHVSCTSADIDDLQLVGEEPSSSSLEPGMVWCIVGSNCQAVSKSACDAFSGIPVNSCPVSSSSKGIPGGSSSSGNVPVVPGSSSSAAKYCYNTLGFNECYIIGVFNLFDGYYEYYWLNADGCIADGGTVVERAWCVANGYPIFDD